MAYSRTQPKEVGRQSPEVGYRPTVAPKWDVLQRDRLAALDDLELDYRPQPTHIREDRHFVIYIIGVIGFLSLLLSMVSPLAGAYLGTPFMFALFTAASVIVGIYTFMTARVWWLAVVYALIGPGIWLFIASPQSANHLPFMGYVFFFLSLGLSGYLADRIATHYASWLAASPQLLGENRKKAKALWDER